MLRTEYNQIASNKEATPPAEEARELLDRSTRNAETETENEAVQDLELMRENADAHITSAIVRHVIGAPEDEATVKVVLPHLCRCSWCRGTLHETLALCDTDPAHTAYVLLAEAENWARWEAAGRHATQSARQFLHERGVNVVYARDGVIWAERPDGTVERVAEVTTPETSSR